MVPFLIQALSHGLKVIIYISKLIEKLFRLWNSEISDVKLPEIEMEMVVAKAVKQIELAQPAQIAPIIRELVRIKTKAVRNLVINRIFLVFSSRDVARSSDDIQSEQRNGINFHFIELYKYYTICIWREKIRHAVSIFFKMF